MSEYIEREAVNALIKAECSPKVAAYLIDAVADIPAADVRPVVGAAWQSWEQDKPPCKWYSCDYCGYHALNKSNFCPNCGADMRPQPPKEERA